MGFNLTCTAGALSSVFHTKATTATIRWQLIAIPARLVNSGRRWSCTYRHWPWRDSWEGLFNAACDACATDVGCASDRHVPKTLQGLLMHTTGQHPARQAAAFAIHGLDHQLAVAQRAVDPLNDSVSGQVEKHAAASRGEHVGSITARGPLC